MNVWVNLDNHKGIIDPDNFIYYKELHGYLAVRLHYFQLNKHYGFDVMVKQDQKDFVETIYFDLFIKNERENFLSLQFAKFIYPVRLTLSKEEIDYILYDHEDNSVIELVIRNQNLDEEYLLQMFKKSRYCKDTIIHSIYSGVNCDKFDSVLYSILESSSTEDFLKYYPLVQNPTQDQTNKYNLLSL